MGETRKFTEDQIEEYFYECGDAYVVIEQKITDSDQEKGYIQKSYIIQEESTSKFFSGSLGESPWWKQGQENAKCVWVEVEPYTVSITKYRKVK